MNSWKTHEQVQRIKEQYLPGTRILLIPGEDSFSVIPQERDMTMQMGGIEQ